MCISESRCAKGTWACFCAMLWWFFCLCNSRLAPFAWLWAGALEDGWIGGNWDDCAWCEQGVVVMLSGGLLFRSPYATVADTDLLRVNETLISYIFDDLYNSGDV
jgi:hypothetical protein